MKVFLARPRLPFIDSAQPHAFSSRSETANNRLIIESKFAMPANTLTGTRTGIQLRPRAGG